MATRGRGYQSVPGHSGGQNPPYFQSCLSLETGFFKEKCAEGMSHFLCHVTLLARSPQLLAVPHVSQHGSGPATVTDVPKLQGLETVCLHLDFAP